jgi:putative nucleotidyltransferase with HDIG domain
MQTNEVRRRIFQIERLATVPHVVWGIVESLNDDRTTAADLEQLIYGDPALASKMLSLANSAYYGLPRNVTTISRAVNVIGIQELQMLAAGVGLADPYDQGEKPADYRIKDLWIHSAAVSYAAGELAETSGHPLPDEVRTAGLLHDLGKLVLVNHLTEYLDRIMALTDAGLSYSEAERQTGLDHSTLGYWLAKRWGLPENHQIVIRDHHHPRPDKPAYITTCLVYLANELVNEVQDRPYPRPPDSMNAEIIAVTNLNTEILEQVQEQTREKLAALAGQFHTSPKEDHSR